ncbi:MAG TPA: aldehyde dehydrogenase family protein [Chitinophagales bacterium]|nr:aldehyde dehydrogenase family protein [Chitinophagales bacterium]HNL85362.1 aldehyde dehydrogenase family protein [Chitinophagales bacterium]
MDFLKNLGIQEINKGVSTGSAWFETSAQIDSYSPVDGKLIASVQVCDAKNYEHVVQSAQKAFAEWKKIPAPKRGEIVRQIGNEFRTHKDDLGRLVSWEMGKSLQEGLGEVQEIIDICDFAVGLSRQLYGLSMHSERPNHRMYEQWHPYGIVGIITAFNFPVAVWGWNAMLALVCGDVCIWKPSEKTPLSALACQFIMSKIIKENNLPEGISGMIVGEREVGEWMTNDTRIPLISATGSTRMGKEVGKVVAERLGRSLLELGGNNAIIITPSADLNVALIGSVFGATGTTGQRCTTTRRLIIHSSIYDEFKTKLVAAYGQLKIGNPLEAGIHVGPLIDTHAVKLYENAIQQCKEQGGRFLVEGEVLSGGNYASGCYVKPCIAEVDSQLPIVMHETFAPILYLMKYDTIEEALALQNAVPQGLSSSIMTMNMHEMEYFLSAQGSDCGIANVNIGTSGAEIGGAFGGEKETGGGRESGSDSWKAYMRRQTNTINFGTDLPLAQGIQFDLG